jgi:hypothetical protein
MGTFISTFTRELDDRTDYLEDIACVCLDLSAVEGERAVDEGLIDRLLLVCYCC